MRPAEQLEAFAAYDARVLPLLAEHGGTLERRLQSADAQVELHLVSFPSDEASPPTAMTSAAASSGSGLRVPGRSSSCSSSLTSSPLTRKPSAVGADQGGDIRDLPLERERLTGRVAAPRPVVVPSAFGEQRRQLLLLLEPAAAEEASDRIGRRLKPKLS